MPSARPSADSVRTGFEQWAQVGWPVFVDLLSPELRSCAAMEMTFPGADDSASERRRRVLFGHPAHRVGRDYPAAAGGEDHAFCPCCLFTNSWEAFAPLLKSDAASGLRLFAMGDAADEIDADCRANGEDCEPGAEALRADAATWLQRGFESRKQYVLIGPQP